MTNAIIRVVESEYGGKHLYTWIPNEQQDNVNQGTVALLHYPEGVLIYHGLYDKVKTVHKLEKNMHQHLEEQLFNGWHDWQDFYDKHMKLPKFYCDAVELGMEHCQGYNIEGCNNCRHYEDWEKNYPNLTEVREKNE